MSGQSGSWKAWKTGDQQRDPLQNKTGISRHGWHLLIQKYHEWHEMEEVVCKVVCRESSSSVQAEASQKACPKFASDMCSRGNSCAISWCELELESVACVCINAGSSLTLEAAVDIQQIRLFETPLARLFALDGMEIIAAMNDSRYGLLSLFAPGF